MTIAHLIRRPVETLPPTAVCTTVAALMRAENVGSVVIADGRLPLGVVTDRDLAVRVMAEGRDPATTLARDVMSSYPVFVSNLGELDDVLRAMREMRVRRLPVVDQEGRIDGIVTMDDVLSYLAGVMGRLRDVVRLDLSAHDD